jgi:transcriptional regulator with XRE-family HTH domain
MTTAIAAALDQVGPRLKQLRSRRGVTLTALSEATGIFRRPGHEQRTCSQVARRVRVAVRPSGRMRLVLGDHDLVLGVGEAAEFDTHVPHWFGSTGDQQAEILSVFGPQGERANARARSVSTKASAE